MAYNRLLIYLVLLLPATGVAQDSVRNKLNEVHVTDKQGTDFGHMNQVDGMRITAGKKTEVIDVKNLNVNKATNNTRQVYAKIGGLNIFENDGSGLQLSIGGRGLDPNRTSNFNVRQNGYDISADVLGYPESYYTPPVEALSKIEIIKGAASLQYGTQFGGLLNFEMTQPGATKSFSIESRQTGGSFGFFGSYNAVSGTIGKLDYYAYGHYKRGDGWRPNSNFESFNGYVDVHYRMNERNTLGIEYTHLNYLAQQPGGLDDKMFNEDPRQSNRARNWFAVNWDLLALEWDNKISARTRWQTKMYGLQASRNAIGFRDNIVSRTDNNNTRDLLMGKFSNASIESRLLHRYSTGNLQQVILFGVRAYRGNANSKQGNVFTGNGADFSFEDSAELNSDYSFPNTNLAAFAEHIVRLTSKFSITPGIRTEYIHTRSNGSYQNRATDLRGVVIFDSTIQVSKQSPRQFLLGGVGLSYKHAHNIEIYGNLSQNYRSVTYNDIVITNASLEIDPAITDEHGWSSDLGIRGNMTHTFRFDGSLFYTHYNNRIGEYQEKSGNRVYRYRANIGAAKAYGVETFMEVDLEQFWHALTNDFKVMAYNNLALTQASYTNSEDQSIVGNRIEYVPLVNWKAGVQSSYKKLKVTYQFSYMSRQFADASNAVSGGFSGVNGEVPAYMLMDISAGWSHKWLTIEASINNVANAAYFTRRATGYPGPGIIPGDGRSFYLTVGVKL